MTRLVHLLGVPTCADDDLMGPTEENPTGYWESRSLTAFNDRLLDALGCDWSSPPALAPGWHREPPVADFAGPAAELFASVMPSGQWVWKDPRLCVTLPFWLDCLEVSPAVVLATRNPLEVADSLARRDRFGKPYALAVWERNLRHALARGRGPAGARDRLRRRHGRPRGVVPRRGALPRGARRARRRATRARRPRLRPAIASRQRPYRRRRPRGPRRVRPAARALHCPRRHGRRARALRPADAPARERADRGPPRGRPPLPRRAQLVREPRRRARGSPGRPRAPKYSPSGPALREATRASSASCSRSAGCARA